MLQICYHFDPKSCGWFVSELPKIMSAVASAFLSLGAEGRAKIVSIDIFTNGRMVEMGVRFLGGCQSHAPANPPFIDDKIFDHHLWIGRSQVASLELITEYVSLNLQVGLSIFLRRESEMSSAVSQSTV